MAVIAYDTSVKGAVNTNSWTHTCTGSNLILFVTQFVVNATTTPTPPTYNGVSMTLVTSCSVSATSDTIWLYSLMNPATGANTVTCTLLNTIGGVGVSVSYSGVSPIGFPDSHFYDTTNVTGTGSLAETVSTTVIASNCWLLGFNLSIASNNNTSGASSNRTDRQNSLDGTYGHLIASDSNGTVATGSQSITYTSTAPTGNLYSASFVLSIAPYVSTINTLVTLPATFTFTGRSINIARVFRIAALPAVFLVTTIPIGIQKITGWIRSIKHSSIFSNKAKDPSTFTTQAKHTSAWTDKNKTQ